VAARGGDAVVLIDGFEYLPAAAARRALAAGRNLAGGGSLTVIATSPEPIGGETTVVALDRALAAAGSFPALALSESGTLRPELLVGESGAAAIRSAGGDAPAPVVVPEAPAAPVVETPAVLVAEAATPAPAAAKQPAGRVRKRAPKAAATTPAAKRPAAKAKPAAAAKKPAAKAKSTAAKKPAAAKAKPKTATAAKKPATKRKPAARKRAAN